MAFNTRLLLVLSAAFLLLGALWLLPTHGTAPMILRLLFAIALLNWVMSLVSAGMPDAAR